MSDADLMAQLMAALRCLPGVGPRTAQRMCLHLLERDRDGGRQLSKILAEAMESIGRCQRCRNLTEHSLCKICQSSNRDPAYLCIVESPADVIAIEQATAFQGLYYVLLGKLSPIDGIGPEELGLEQLKQRFHEDDVKEVIIATNPTVEGEATAFYIQKMAQRANLKVSRISQGVPVGGELEYTDASTLAHAFGTRQPLL